MIYMSKKKIRKRLEGGKVFSLKSPESQDRKYFWAAGGSQYHYCENADGKPNSSLKFQGTLDQMVRAIWVEINHNKAQFEVKEIIA